MLKLGDSQICPVFLGESKIMKAFLGGRLVYEAKNPSGLPDGYTKVEYIQSDGNAYIQTDISTESSAFKTVMDVEPTTSAAGYFFGVSKQVYLNGALHFYYFYAKKEKASDCRVRFGLDLQLIGHVDVDVSNKRTLITLDKLNSVGKVDDLESEKFKATRSYETLSLLSYKSMDRDGTVKYLSPLAAKLYSCKCFGDGEDVLGDFIPCLNPSGVAGLYDQVGKTFYKSNGTKNFTAGPAV